MASVADLLDLWPEEDVAAGLHEKPDTVQQWKRAGAIPEDRARALVEFALLRGHLEEVARMAAETSPYVSDLAGLMNDISKIHDVGKKNKSFQKDSKANHPVEDTTPPSRSVDLPITKILEEMQEHRIFEGDPVARIRALRAEWDWRDEYHDRIRRGDID